jgi:hypothetical protein
MAASLVEDASSWRKSSATAVLDAVMDIFPSRSALLWLIPPAPALEVGLLDLILQIF